MRGLRFWSFGGVVATLVVPAIWLGQEASGPKGRVASVSLIGHGGVSNVPSASVSEAARLARLSADFDQKIAPMIQKYCFDCHSGTEKSGGLLLDGFKTPAQIAANPKQWEKVILYVRNQQMPPEDVARPTMAERDQLIDWTSQVIYGYDPAKPLPGRVTIRRLNRTEYNNTVRDLVGLDLDLAKQFPMDDTGYGFDNIGDVLSLPPMLMEKYVAAADQVLDRAIVTDTVRAKVTQTPGSMADAYFYSMGDRGDGWVRMATNQQDFIRVAEEVTATAEYTLRAMAFSEPTGGILPQESNLGGTDAVPAPPKPTTQPAHMVMSFMMDDTIVKDVVVKATEAKPELYEATFTAPPGKHHFGVMVRRFHGVEEDQVRVNSWLGKEQEGIVFARYLEVDGPAAYSVRRYEMADLEKGGTTTASRDGLVLGATGDEAGVSFEVPKDAELTLRAEACQNYGGNEPAKMEMRIDGQAVAQFEVKTPGRMLKRPNEKNYNAGRSRPWPQLFETKVRVPAGKHRFTVAFVNDFKDPTNPNPNLRDRNLLVQHLEIVDPSQPLERPALPPKLAEIFVKHGVQDEKASTIAPEKRATAARSILADFGRRAFRRPLKADELDRLVSLYKLSEQQNDTFYVGVKLAMKATLCSPHFLFRGEPPAGPNVSAPGAARGASSVTRIDEFSLASRLSYFLWSTMPDDELLDLAERGELRKNLSGQVRRMLKSPKSSALVENFGSQWLQYRQLESHNPNNRQFTSYNNGIRDAMAKETEMLFSTILREDRSVMEFLTADYTFVNRDLAAYYGMPEVDSEEFQRVSLAGTNRRGVITHGSVLTLTSNPTRTSPVKRGKWVLEQLLGGGPPPPPTDIPGLVEEGAQLLGTLRQQMEKHREDPNCVSCHSIMDPIGFGLENFDAVGAWRDVEVTPPVRRNLGDLNPAQAAAERAERQRLATMPATKPVGPPIDASGQLISGEKFVGGVELSETLVRTRKQDYLRCLSEKMLTYALGRGVEPFDRPAIDGMMRELEAGDCRFSALILAVVDSIPFQMQEQGDATVAAPIHSSNPVPTP